MADLAKLLTSSQPMRLFPPLPWWDAPAKVGVGMP